MLHVRHALWCNFLTSSAKRRCWIFIFEFLTTTRACRSKSFVHCLCMKTTRANASERTLRLFHVKWPTWNSCKTLNRARGPISKRRFDCSSRRRLLIKLPYLRSGRSDLSLLRSLKTAAKEANLTCQFRQMVLKRSSLVAGYKRSSSPLHKLEKAKYHWLS